VRFPFKSLNEIVFPVFDGREKSGADDPTIGMASAMTLWTHTGPATIAAERGTDTAIVRINLDVNLLILVNDTDKQL